MAAKKIQISDDNGSTWFTFPGSSGEFNRETGDINDTILGQNFQSSQPGLVGWTVNTNGVYKGFAGYVAKILKSGTPTSMTAEAMTLVSGKTFKITAATKNVWNRLIVPTFTDNGVAVPTGDILSIDYLFGRVTFTAGHTVTGPIVLATGSYLPMTQVAAGNSFDLTQTTQANNSTTFDVAQTNGGYRVYEAGLQRASLSVKGIYKSANAFDALLASRAEMVIEINPDGSNKSVGRGWFKLMSDSQQGDVGDLEEENLNFMLSVPAQDDITIPFSWIIDATSTLSLSLQKALTAWASGALTDVRYLHDGTNGWKGDAIVTDLSLSGGLEAMNDFQVKFQGCGAYTAVP